jgi:hypothetical protein
MYDMHWLNVELLLLMVVVLLATGAWGGVVVKALRY